MTRRHTSRLATEGAALVLILALLFSASITSAAPPDRTPPTTPTNIRVTTATETTISLAWNPSTDNSGSFSYKLRLNNSTVTLSQSQTTYTMRFLRPNSTHTVSVYAVDRAGNRSGDSNRVTTSTLPDMTPPSAPTPDLTVLSPSQVRLTWTRSTDNVPNYCCLYGITMNGSRPTEHVNWWSETTVTIRHLTPATTYVFTVQAWDWSGNVATSNTVTETTESSSDTVAPSAPTNLRLIYDQGCAEVWIGWDQSTDNIDAQSDIEYEIYVNGVLSPLHVSAGIDRDFVYGTAQGENTFIVKAVDRSGNTSAASNAITLHLWPC